MKYIINDGDTKLIFTDPIAANEWIQNYYENTDYGIVCVGTITADTTVFYCDIV